MNQDILYLLLLGSLLFLKTKGSTNSMIGWIVLVSSFYLLFFDKESFVDRKNTKGGKSKVWIEDRNKGKHIQPGKTTKLTANSRNILKLDLHVPETIAFEVVSTLDCRKSCQAPDLQLTADQQNNLWTSGFVTDPIVKGGVDSSVNYIAATKTILAGGKPNGGPGPIGATINTSGDDGMQIEMNAGGGGCDWCQFGTLSGENSDYLPSGKNLGSEGCTSSCIYNAWNQCGKTKSEETASECQVIDRSPETGIDSDAYPKRIGTGATWNWGDEGTGPSTTNDRPTKPATDTEIPSGVRNLQNRIFAPKITISSGKPASHNYFVNTMNKSPEYYRCWNQSPTPGVGTVTSDTGTSCQNDKTVATMWFNKGVQGNQPTNLLGDYGYLKFNYDIDLGKLCPPGKKGEYKITLEFPRALFCDADTSSDKCKNKFTFTVQCPDITPDDNEPQCNEYDSGDISDHCKSLKRMYDPIKDTYKYGNEPDTCCGEPFPNCKDVTNMDGLTIDSLVNYCKNTFNKYEVTEPENTFFDSSEIEPSEIEAICCGEPYPPSCSEPERLIPDDFEPGIPAETTLSVYCKNNNYTELDSPSETIPEPGPALLDQCCGDHICPTKEEEIEPPCDNIFNTDRYFAKQPLINNKSCCPCEEYDVNWRFVGVA